MLLIKKLQIITMKLSEQPDLVPQAVTGGFNKIKCFLTSKCVGVGRIEEYQIDTLLFDYC